MWSQLLLVSGTFCSMPADFCRQGLGGSAGAPAAPLGAALLLVLSAPTLPPCLQGVHMLQLQCSAQQAGLRVLAAHCRGTSGPSCHRSPPPPLRPHALRPPASVQTTSLLSSQPPAAGQPKTRLPHCRGAWAFLELSLLLSARPLACILAACREGHFASAHCPAYRPCAEHKPADWHALACAQHRCTAMQACWPAG